MEELELSRTAGGNIKHYYHFRVKFWKFPKMWCAISIQWNKTQQWKGMKYASIQHEWSPTHVTPDVRRSWSERCPDTLRLGVQSGHCNNQPMNVSMAKQIHVSFPPPLALPPSPSLKSIFKIYKKEKKLMSYKEWMINCGASIQWNKHYTAIKINKLLIHETT